MDVFRPDLAFLRQVASFSRPRSFAAECLLAAGLSHFR